MLIRIVLGLLLMSNYALAQVEPPEAKNQAQVSELFQYMKAVYEREPTILVPFIENEKFGLLDYQTLQVVVPAMANSLPLVNTADKDSQFGSFYAEGATYGFSMEHNRLLAVVDGHPPENWVVPARLGVKVLPADHPFKGFTYERNNEGRLQLTSYPEIYKNQGTYSSPYYPHLTVIEIDDEVFAIAQNQKYQVGIIDTAGNPVTGFDFNYQRVIPIRGAKESLGAWFLAMKDDSNDNVFHFVNARGEVMPESVLPALDYSINYVRTQGSTPYHEPVSMLGYGINSGKVIDFYELKQVKSIPTEYKAIYLDAVSTSAIHTDDLEEQRKHTLMFAVVEDENGNRFYMDFDGKKYLPNN